MMRFFDELVLTGSVPWHCWPPQPGPRVAAASVAVRLGPHGPERDAERSEAHRRTVGKVQETLARSDRRTKTNMRPCATPRRTCGGQNGNVERDGQRRGKKVLSFSAEQSKRYDQINLQARGVQAFASSTVDEQFKLSNDQKSKIREIVEASRSSFAGAFNKDASEQERTDARNKMAATQKENMTKVQALLTDGQKNAWKELIGEPIEIQYPTRRSNNRPSDLDGTRNLHSSQGGTVHPAKFFVGLLP